MGGLFRAGIAFFALLGLSACSVDRANTPQLVAVGYPALSAWRANCLCVGQANFAYRRAGEEFELRDRMTLYETPSNSAFWKERQSRQAANFTYRSCIAASGYRPIYAYAPVSSAKVRALHAP